MVPLPGDTMQKYWKIATKHVHITIYDLVAKGPSDMLYTSIINLNTASTMLQVSGVKWDELGNLVPFVCYTGPEHFIRKLLDLPWATWSGGMKR